MWQLRQVINCMVIAFGPSPLRDHLLRCGDWSEGSDVSHEGPERAQGPSPTLRVGPPRSFLPETPKGHWPERKATPGPFTRWYRGPQTVETNGAKTKPIENWFVLGSSFVTRAAATDARSFLPCGTFASFRGRNECHKLLLAFRAFASFGQ